MHTHTYCMNNVQMLKVDSLIQGKSAICQVVGHELMSIRYSTKMG